MTPTTGAEAHDLDDLDAWVTEWIERALVEGVTLEAVAEIVDMANRHPRYFGRPVPARANVSPGRVPTRVWTGTVEQWRPLVSAYFATEQVDRAMRVMACESGGNPSAKNPRSSASGLFQHLARYWPSRSAKAGWAGASIWDPTANVAVAAWLWRTGGWGHWECK